MDVALVCGGRDYQDRAHVYATLDTAHALRPISVLVHGACHLGGADILADDWARSRGVARWPFPADRRRGRLGGPERNSRMLAQAQPTIVYAFPGGRGTANMVGKARAAGVPVVTA